MRRILVVEDDALYFPYFFLSGDFAGQLCCGGMVLFALAAAPLLLKFFQKGSVVERRRILWPVFVWAEQAGLDLKVRGNGRE